RAARPPVAAEACEEQVVRTRVDRTVRVECSKLAMSIVGCVQGGERRLCRAVVLTVGHRARCGDSEEHWVSDGISAKCHGTLLWALHRGREVNTAASAKDATRRVRDGCHIAALT